MSGNSHYMRQWLPHFFLFSEHPKWISLLDLSTTHNISSPVGIGSLIPLPGMPFPRDGPCISSTPAIWYSVLPDFLWSSDSAYDSYLLPMRWSDLFYILIALIILLPACLNLQSQLWCILQDSSFLRMVAWWVSGTFPDIEAFSEPVLVTLKVTIWTITQGIYGTRWWVFCSYK